MYAEQKLCLGRRIHVGFVFDKVLHEREMALARRKVDDRQAALYWA
jgi:hypothetical protein